MKQEMILNDGCLNKNVLTTETTDEVETMLKNLFNNSKHKNFSQMCGGLDFLGIPQALKIEYCTYLNNGNTTVKIRLKPEVAMCAMLISFDLIRQKLTLFINGKQIKKNMMHEFQRMLDRLDKRLNVRA